METLTIPPPETYNMPFLRACRAQNLAGFTFALTPRAYQGRPYVRLERGKDEHIWSTDLEVEVDVVRYGLQNYELARVFFQQTLYSAHPGHIETFLARVKRTHLPRFRLLCFNQNEHLTAIGWVCHELYGLVGTETYLLFSYKGPDNQASPVRVRPLSSPA